MCLSDIGLNVLYKHYNNKLTLRNIFRVVYCPIIVMRVISNKTVEELLGQQGSFLALILYHPEREAQMTYGIREEEPYTLKKHASPLTDSFRLLMSG